MYSKEESAKIRSAFWTTFGKYMHPVPSASGQAVNWINYKTGVKKIRFQLEVENNQAGVSVVLMESNPELIEKMFDVLKMMKEDMNKNQSTEWLVDQKYWKGDKCYKRIFIYHQNVNMYNKQQWPEIISFLKTSMIQLDNAWINYQPVLEMLSDDV